MKILTTVLVLLVSTPLAAQGPIAESVAHQYGTGTLPPGRYTTAMASPALFWSGAALVAGGSIAIIASMTWAQQSDLSLEDPSTRLGRDLAPCNTDPAHTRLVIADCKNNVGLQIFGILVSAGGGAMMAYGGQRVQIIAAPSRVGVRVRF
jgi:hypothetical protein